MFIGDCRHDRFQFTVLASTYRSLSVFATDFERCQRPWWGNCTRSSGGRPLWTGQHPAKSSRTATAALVKVQTSFFGVRHCNSQMMFLSFYVVLTDMHLLFTRVWGRKASIVREVSCNNFCLGKTPSLSFHRDCSRLLPHRQPSNISLKRFCSICSSVACNCHWLSVLTGTPKLRFYDVIKYTCKLLSRKIPVRSSCVRRDATLLCERRC